MSSIISPVFIDRVEMLKQIFFLTLVLKSVCCALNYEDDIFPLNLRMCKISSNNYSDCFINAIQSSWPVFVRGVPQFESPPLDPLKIDYIEKNLKIGQLGVETILTDNKFYGLVNTKFLKVYPRFTNNRVQLDLRAEIPKLYVDGNYKARGLYNFLINIHAAGYFNVSMENVTAKWSVTGRVENDRWIIDHFQNDLEIKGLKLYFSDLFHGYDTLNYIVRSLINQRWRLFFRQLKPTIQEISNVLVVEILNRDIFSKVAVSKIFTA